MTEPTTKRARLERLLADGAWADAIKFAAKFQDLGAERGAILSAREALLRPAFQRQIGRTPETLISNGKAALRRRYGDAK